MNRSEAPTRLVLYRRAGCELCNEARTLLEAACGDGFDAIDIGWFGPLAKRYGVRIPVLRRDDGAELDWPFDAVTVARFLDR